FEPAHAVIEGIAEGTIFVFVPTGPDAEYQASSADLVDGIRHLRHQRRVAERGAGDERAEFDVFGRGGESGKDRPAVPEALYLVLTTIFIGVEEMIDEPERVEADRFGECGH